MLEEAVALIRCLWQGGLRSHQGQYYTVENAQLYTLPELLLPILIAASGTRSAHMAGRLGDGLITVGVHAKLVDRFIAAGGAGKPRYTELNVCWAPEEAEARRLAHARWPIATHALYGMITVAMYNWLRERVLDSTWSSGRSRRPWRVISG